MSSSRFSWRNHDSWVSSLQMMSYFATNTRKIGSWNTKRKSQGFTLRRKQFPNFCSKKKCYAWRTIRLMTYSLLILGFEKIPSSLKLLFCSGSEAIDNQIFGLVRFLKYRTGSSSEVYIKSTSIAKNEISNTVWVPSTRFVFTILYTGSTVYMTIVRTCAEQCSTYQLSRWRDDDKLRFDFYNIKRLLSANCLKILDNVPT